jgi:hypothetical protein
MKKIVKFEDKDKQYVKMINQKDSGFELVFLSDIVLNHLLKEIKNYDASGYETCIIWQMKFKEDNYIVYNNCKFSEPEDNYFTKFNNWWGGYIDKTPKLCGKKIKVTCKNSTYYTSSPLYRDKPIIPNPFMKCSRKYKDRKLLERSMKLNDINIKSKEDYE